MLLKSSRRFFYCCTAVLLCGLSTNAFAGKTTIVNVDSSGKQADAKISLISLSANGRYVGFTSEADKLVDGDTNKTSDVFVHDLQSGETSRVSVGTDDRQGNADSWLPNLSADGRYIAFVSNASNLVSGDSNKASDIFVYDSFDRVTSRVSVAYNGVQANKLSLSPSISADGRYVVFASDATNLVKGDNNGKLDIFVRDRVKKTTTLVSVSSTGAKGNKLSSTPTLSANGRYVAFMSEASNFVSGDTNGKSDIFVRDLQDKLTSRVSVASNGTQANLTSLLPPSISADGRYVAFMSNASNLVSGDSNNVADVFLHDRLKKLTTRVSAATNSKQGNGSSRFVSINADGRFVTFTSDATNLMLGDSNAKSDIFVHDRIKKTTVRVSVASNGAQKAKHSLLPSISANGQRVAFLSEINWSNNEHVDVFVRDR
jgi:Tol biopolymer transport system component